MKNKVSEYVIKALDSNYSWDKKIVTYSIPVESSTWDYSGEPNSEYTVFNATQAEQFRKAINAWDELISINFVEVLEPNNKGDIRIAFTFSENAAGWASYPSNSDSARSGDIWINTKYTSSQTELFEKGSHRYETLLHELGHAIGLNHPFSLKSINNKQTFFIDNKGKYHYLPKEEENELYTLMSYTTIVRSKLVNFDYVQNSGMSFTVSFRPETPMLYDIAVIQNMYGANNMTRVGNDIYEFHENILEQPFYKTLWDAGGIDTIDTSKQVNSSLINLAAGSFSSIGYLEINELKEIILDAFPQHKNWLNETYFPKYNEELYTGKNNLSIAYNVIIENAIGGKNNDILLGNQADNQFTGNQGNDFINGELGFDTAIYQGNYKYNEYEINLSNDGNQVIVKNLIGNDGVDTLENIEQLKFLDTIISVETIKASFHIPTNKHEVITHHNEGSPNNINYFLVEISSTLMSTASFHYETRDGSAIAGQDYIKTDGIGIIPIGENHIAIGVEIINDILYEEDEFFSLVITQPSNGIFPENVTELVATHTIVNDDSVFNNPINIIGNNQVSLDTII